MIIIEVGIRKVYGWIRIKESRPWSLREKFMDMGIRNVYGWSVFEVCFC